MNQVRSGLFSSWTQIAVLYAICVLAAAVLATAALVFDVRALSPVEYGALIIIVSLLCWFGWQYIEASKGKPTIVATDARMSLFSEFGPVVFAASAGVFAGPIMAGAVRVASESVVIELAAGTDLPTTTTSFAVFVSHRAVS